MLCSNLKKFKIKKKNLKSNFFETTWFEKSQKEKYKEKLRYYEEKNFLPNIRGK